MIDVYKILKNNPHIKIKAPLFIGGNVDYCLLNFRDGKRLIKFWDSDVVEDNREAYVYWCDCYGVLWSYQREVPISIEAVIEPLEGTWEELSKGKKPTNIVGCYLSYVNADFGSSICYVKERIDSYGVNDFTYLCYDIIHARDVVQSFPTEVFGTSYDICPRFDPTLCTPFQKILMYDDQLSEWLVHVYSNYDENNVLHYGLGGKLLDMFVPYNDMTKRLLGTDGECDKFYRFWEEV